MSVVLYRIVGITKKNKRINFVLKVPHSRTKKKSELIIECAEKK